MPAKPGWLVGCHKETKEKVRCTESYTHKHHLQTAKRKTPSISKIHNMLLEDTTLYAIASRNGNENATIQA